MKEEHAPPVRTVRWRGVILRLIALALALLGWSLFAAGCAREPGPVSLAPAKPPATRAGRIALYRKTVQAFLKAGRLPIIDMEVMLSDRTPAARLIGEMDRAGVAIAAVTSRSAERIRSAVRRHPARLVPLTAAPGGMAWAAPGGGFLKSVRAQIKAGRIGIGRVRLDLGPGEFLKGEKKEARKKDIKTQKAAFEALLRLSAETKTPIWLEMEPEDDGVGWLERQLRAHPRASVMWNRAGLLPTSAKLPGYGHGLLRALTLRRPNLFLILTQRPPRRQRIFPSPRANLLFDPGGGFSPEWRTMIEARIAHFHTGSSMEPSRPNEYLSRVRTYRARILDALTPAARRRLAYRNAWRFIAREKWKE
jgi:hypothetical protein